MVPVSCSILSTSFWRYLLFILVISALVVYAFKWNTQRPRPVWSTVLKEVFVYPVASNIYDWSSGDVSLCVLIMSYFSL